MRWHWAICLLVFTVSACSGVTQRPEQPPRPTVTEPLWEGPALRRHLGYFNVAGERITGSNAFDEAATYAASQMRSYRLQPALESGFRVPYTLSYNDIGPSRLATATPSDTLPFYLGVDFLPDGRTGTNTISGAAVEIVPYDTPVEPGNPVILLPQEQATTAYLHAARNAGTRAALTVGSLRPTSTDTTIAGMVVLQVTPEAAARILDTAPAALSSFFEAEESFQWSLSRRLHMSTQSYYRTQERAYNLSGIVTGQHPIYDHELVLVCADLDALGGIEGVEVGDYEHLGIGAAALLEVARNYVLFSHWTNIPERSLMFAILSGGRQGQAGLRGYFESPLWDTSRMRAVVYLGLSGEDEADVRELLDGYDIPLYTVPLAGDGAFGQDVVVRPVATGLLGTRPSRPGQPLPSLPNRDEVLDRGARVADSLAQAAHDVLLPLAVHPGPFKPAEEDTLEVPEEI